MGIYRFEVYRSSNIGIYLKSNERILLVPRGVAPTKAKKLGELLDVECVQASIGETRLLGPLVVMNSNGIVVSRFASEEEIQDLRRSTGLPVERLPDRFTTAGNLIAANDKGGAVSTLLPRNTVSSLESVLGVPLQPMKIGPYVQVGSMVMTTNAGAAVHPQSSEEDIQVLKDILKVDVEPATVNGGVPFISSGLIANSKNAIVGPPTTGPELIILSRVLKV